MELKDKLQMLMARAALNGQKLARLSRVSDSEISRILQGKSRPGLTLAQKVGCSQVVTILENIRFLGYEVAMSRLVGGKPIIEVDKEIGEHRSNVPPPVITAASVSPRTSSATA
jgi:transcriptional regulator with XRE-family HTH domain